MNIYNLKRLKLGLLKYKTVMEYIGKANTEGRLSRLFIFPDKMVVRVWFNGHHWCADCYDSEFVEVVEEPKS